MSDIQRYKIDFEQLIESENGWLMKVEDHKKTIKAKDKELIDETTYSSGLEGIIKEQSNEIKRLKKALGYPGTNQ